MIDKDMPCTRDCPKRHIGCHGKCPDYIKWHENQVKRKQAEKKQKEIERNLNAYEADRKERLKKRIGKR